MKKYWPNIACLLFLAEIILIILSWLLSVALPNSGVRSMLSGEGIRWFMGHFGNILATPQLAWLLLAVIAIGCLRRCGVLGHVSSSSSLPMSYRERRALLLGGASLLLCVVAVLLLTVTPHAVLISATGDFFPSPFSYSLIPVASFSICLSSIVYGVVAGSFLTLRDVYDALSYGIRWAAPCILFYILIVQLYASMRFVFG